MMTCRLNPSVRFRLGFAPVGEIQIVVDEGSMRTGFECDEPDFVGWLLTLRTPFSEAEAVASAIECMGVDENGARALLAKALENRLLVQDAEAVADSSSTAKTWERWGWRDALDFHRATRDLEWDVGHSDKPEIMTTRLGGERIQPEEDRPERWTGVETDSILELPLGESRIDTISFGDATYSRRTCREFTGRELSLESLAAMLGHGLGGLNARKGLPYHATPTYAIGYPFRVFVVVINVQGLRPGIYLYSPPGHALHRTRRGDFGREVRELVYGQDGMRNISAALFYTVRWSHYMWKYRFSRSYRLALFEAASLVQTQLVCASALGLKTFLTPAINDIDAARFLGIADDLEESPLYVTALG